MRTRRLITLLFSFILALCIILSATGCGDAPTSVCTNHVDADGDGICDTVGCSETVENKNHTPPNGTHNENGELYLFKDGVPTFKFVLGWDVLGSFTDKVKGLAESISDYTKNNIEPEVESAFGEIGEVEILIGNVDNRGDEYVIDKYDYGYTGYVVKQIGTKIIVVGGSDVGLASALDHLKENVFGLKKTREPYGTLSMAEDMACSVSQTKYSIEDVTVNSRSIKDYVITYDKAVDESLTAAEDLQFLIYSKMGAHPKIIASKNADNRNKIAIVPIENDGEGGGFYVTVDENDNLIIECEYTSKLSSLITDFFEKKVFHKNRSFNFPSDYSYAPNLRDIYYSDYGAVGDGVTDDFFAIKAAHDDANANLLNVHADPNATYYIGGKNGKETINVRTNTYWHGCAFIFDDEKVDYDDIARRTPIFSISSDYKAVTYNDSTSPVKSLEKGAKNIGWAPGETLMIALYQEDIRHYIRSGANASQSTDPMKWGQAQHELIIVDKDGNVDPSTPVQWTYTTVTSMDVYRISDAPIVVRGEGEDGKRTTVTTVYNDAPNAYWYYERNITITRSNAVISGLEHIYTSYTLYSDGGNGSPYSGFIKVSSCSNVVVDNMVYECPPGYYDVEPSKRPSSQSKVTNGSMGSYEISATLANNVTWSNSTQSNFFQADGSVEFDGSMGTNFCKNLTFDNMFTCSFDAHCGVYNGTIKNSTLEHLNFIGDGLIRYENVTVYADATRAAISLRTDYGSTWAGDVYIDGLTFKLKAGTKVSNLRIIKAEWNNWYYGYTTYLPQNITLKNVLTARYTYSLVGEGNGTNNRVESEEYVYNDTQLRVFTNTINESLINYGADTYLGSKNKNPMVATKEIRLYTEYTGKYAELGITTPLNLKPPSGTFFRSLKYYVDDELQ